MATEVQMSGYPAALWITVDHQNNGEIGTLYSIRGENHASVAVRVKLTLGRGSNLTTYARVLPPATQNADGTITPTTDSYTFNPPQNLRSQPDWGIGIEEV